MKNIIILLLSIMTIPTYAQKREGQQRIDSLLQELPKMKEDTNKVLLLTYISFGYTSILPKEGVKYGNQALLLAKQLNYNFGIANAYKNIAHNYNALYDYENAKINFENGLKIVQNKIEKADILSGLGMIYYNINDYTKSLDYRFKALKIYEEENSEKGKSQEYSNIGMTYSDLSNNDKAIEYLEKALVINIKINSKTEQIRNLGNLGTAYNNKKEFQKALDYHTRAIKLCDEIGQDGSKVINLYSIGSIYFNLKEFDKSINYCNQSLLLCKKLDNQMGLVKNQGLIGDNYFEKYKLSKNKENFIKIAMKNHSEALEMAKKMGGIRDMSENLEVLSLEYEEINNHKQALIAYKEFVSLKDSIFNTDNKETIKNLEDKREIELRDKELKINKLSLAAKEKQKWFYLFGISLLGIIGSLLYYQSRKRKKTNEKLQLLNNELDQANKIKTRFFGILNHDLRSPVANLIHFLHLQKDSPELLDEATKQRMQAKTITGAEDLLASMEDILLWSKGQMESFQPAPKTIAVHQLFEDTKKVFSGYQSIQFDYQNPDNIELFTDENYLKTIIRNLTSNAINVFTATQNPQITWKAWQENGKKYLSITDNGAGGTKEQFKALYDDKEVVGIKTGLGLHLIRDLAKAIDCTIDVVSIVDEGTTITLKI
jgi:signal transduction histidine kinase/tetratricopeptide (TPR) repeat protein